jgi:hypothetical protein
VWTLCASHHVFVDQHHAAGAKYLWATAQLGIAGYDELMRRSLLPGSRIEAIESALMWLPVREAA